jgi:hypothetical protein
MDQAGPDPQDLFKPGFGPSAMGYLAPARIDDEALSGWLVRIAHAHYLTLAQLRRETGLCWYRLDEGDLEHVQALSTMLGRPVEEAQRNLLRDRDDLPPSPADTWVVCPACLESDVADGGAPYIRKAWVDPLATFCLEHDLPLVHQDISDPFGKVFADTTGMVEFNAYQYIRDLEAKDILRLSAFEADRRRPDSRSKRRKIREVADIAAALVLPADRYFPHSVVDHLNTCYGRRAIIRRRRDFNPDVAWSYWARARLGLLRATLSLLERPRKPQRKGTGVHNYGQWLTKRSKQTETPGQALVDPLLFLAVALCPDDRRIVTERSAGWRPPIRRRWKDCATLVDRWEDQWRRPGR